VEKVRLRRVANSFSVQVPVIEFIGKPVQSLFSSFVSTTQDPQLNSKQWLSATYDSFASSECRNFSASDLNMIIQHDEDEIK
jgi:hypothetical protein